MRVAFYLLISAAWTALPVLTAASGSSQRRARNDRPKEEVTHTITLKPSVLHPVSSLLYGVFFEEVGLWQYHGCVGRPLSLVGYKSPITGIKVA